MSRFLSSERSQREIASEADYTVLAANRKRLLRKTTKAGNRSNVHRFPARPDRRPHAEREGYEGLSLGLLRAVDLLAQFAEVLLDDLAIPLGHVTGEFPHAGLAIARGQLAPLLGQILD